MPSYKARYFPVSERPLKFGAGLSRFGTDFGQGVRDRQFFQLDNERARYLSDKREAPAERHVLGRADAAAVEARAAALGWMRATLFREAPEVLRACEADAGARDEFDALARALQEDFCVLCAGEDFEGRATLLDVRFASGWRPERLADADFRTIHGPVPGFADQVDVAKSMVRTMVQRGPFVRFMWTISPDDRLDHHPDAKGRASWQHPAGVWLRIERQVTVPLPAANASVFLIRTYHYSLAELGREQRAELHGALERMPSMIRTYKGLPEPAAIAALFTRAEAAPERALR